MQYEAVIGLEVHTQLLTNTKIFCGCSTRFGAPPNANTCPVCLGMPGVLPVLNKKVVDYAIRLALATSCKVAGQSCFARKNYFYPDLPKGYQISQYETPIAEHGQIFVEVDGKPKRIGITRIHMEEDAGKLIHDPQRPISKVDYNRTGVPLLEIVSEPDLRTPEEAGMYLRKLHALVRYLEICDGNMEEGSFRCDANVSIRPVGNNRLGTRTELKNLNSFKHVENAIAYEIERQKAVLSDGGQLFQETRLWDQDRGVTSAMRGKEEAHDYRYFPDPDLVPVVVDDQWVAKMKEHLPELPGQKQKRFVECYGLPDYDAQLLTSSRPLADYFEACAALLPKAKLVSNWIMGTLLSVLNARNMTIEQSPVTAQGLAELLQLIDTGVISGKIAKTVFDEMVEEGRSAKAIVEEKGLLQISDSDSILETVKQVLQNSQNEVAAYKAGKIKLMGYFVGEVMKATRGKANPQKVNEVLKSLLSG